MTRERDEWWLYPAVKRGMDLAVATICLALFAPLFLVIALLVKIDSRGPVFFRQTRIGKGGKPFRFYKFRSMIRDAERHKAALRDLNEAEEPLFKIRRDPRVTTVGYFLRRMSLD
ncbi:MAG: sugar transferase, partial [Candidatus Eisenbacteria bacterium]